MFNKGVYVPDCYRQIFLTLGDAALLVDAAGAILEANPAAAWLFGHPAPELPGHSVREFLAPESLEHFDMQWQKLKSAERFQFHTKCLGINQAAAGIRIDVSRLRSDEHPKKAEELFLLLAREAATPEDELEREAQLQRLSAGRGLAGLATASFFISASGDIKPYPPRQESDKPGPLDWAAAVLTGPRARAALVRAWAGEEAVLAPAWYSPSEAITALGAGSVSGAALEQQRWLSITFLPLRRHGTAVTEVCARVLDETDRRLRRAEQCWHDQQRHRDLLAEALYHDLNNKLSVILAQASGLKLATPPEQLPASGLGAIMDAAQEAAGLLRAAASPHARPAKLLQAVVDLNAVVRDCAALLAHLNKGRCALALELGPDVPAVVGEEDLLRTLVLALGRHVQGLAPPGGRMSLKTLRQPPAMAGLPASAELHIGTTLAGGDAGAPRTTHTGGRAGLLDDTALSSDVALARAIVRAHRGRCDNTSSGAQGTFWTVTLPGSAEPGNAPPALGLAGGDAGAPTARKTPPAVGAPASPPARQEDAPPGRSAPCKILLADDEENFRTFMAWTLRGRGYEIVAARDGQEAFERFQEAPESFSLAILDAYMPRMGGLEAYLRMQMLRPDLPVLFASGFTREASVDVLVAGCPGPASVLLKPFSESDLLEAVRKALTPV
ncbi:MAG: response regulator [Planctomycetota bacterium]